MQQLQGSVPSNPPPAFRISVARSRRRAGVSRLRVGKGLILGAGAGLVEIASLWPCATHNRERCSRDGQLDPHVWRPIQFAMRIVASSSNSRAEWSPKLPSATLNA